MQAVNTTGQFDGNSNFPSGDSFQGNHEKAFSGFPESTREEQ